jgi:predicted Zn finger-like uncharacterized protein
MFSRCPSCQSVYQLQATELAEAAGVVRCSNCGKTFNSLSHLFADQPEDDSQPLQGSGMPPLLKQQSIVQPELPGVSLPEPHWPEPGPSLNLERLDDDQDWRQNGTPWLVTSLVLAAILVTQLIIQVRTPGTLLHQWQAATTLTGSTADAAETIQITSRDMHRHPTLDDAVIISATLRNPSNHNLAWPVLEVRLFDPSQQILGVRRLPPEDYLASPDLIDRGMLPEVIVPVIVELVVGTTDPSGFAFRFY